MSRSEIAILSKLGQIPNMRNSSPPMIAPVRPSARFFHSPKPPRSQVIKAPAMPPPQSDDDPHNDLIDREHGRLLDAYGSDAYTNLTPNLRSVQRARPYKIFKGD